MYTERFQILLSREQRRRLEGLARARGASVASLVREAVDARFGAVGAEERTRAVEEISAMRAVVDLTPAQIGEIIAEEREAAIPDSAGGR